VSPGLPWSKLEISLDNFVSVPSGFKWWDVDQIQFNIVSVSGVTSGSWDIDIIVVDREGVFDRNTIIDSMDALTNWSSDGPTLSVGTTAPIREGTGYLEIPVPGSGNFQIWRTWPGIGPYPSVGIDDSAFRVWYRSPTVTTPGSINQFWIRLTDSSGNKVFNNTAHLRNGIIPSGESEWTPFEFLKSDFLVESPATSFDFTQIVEARFITNGISAGSNFTLELDLFESGDLSRVQSVKFDIGETFNQVKIFTPHITNGHTLDFSTLDVAASSLFNMNEIVNDKVFYDITEGEWVDVNGSSQKFTYRVLGRRVAAISGVSILWRTV
jgi:hypothetical protein